MVDQSVVGAGRIRHPRAKETPTRRGYHGGLKQGGGREDGHLCRGATHRASHERGRPLHLQIDERHG